MKSTTTGFAVCDTANGYIKPSDVSASSTGTFNGHCIPACYMKGYQYDGTAAPGPASKEDKCFILDTDTDFTYAEFSDTALAQSTTLNTKQLGCMKSTTTFTKFTGTFTYGFCECKEDWKAESVTPAPTFPASPYTGACIPPCYVGGKDTHTNGTFDECFPAADLLGTSQDNDLWDEQPGCILDPDTYYCKCDTENGWVDDPVAANDARCVPNCLVKDQQTITVGTTIYADECWPDTADITIASPATYVADFTAVSLTGH